MDPTNFGNPNRDYGLYGDLYVGRTDRFGILTLDGRRFIVPEDWTWAIEMRKGQRRPKTIPSRLPESAQTVGKATIRTIKARIRELAEPQPRDRYGRYASRRATA